MRERTAQAVITDNKLTRFNQLQIICETGFDTTVKPKPNPEPPGISCDGAESSVEMAFGIKIGSSVPLNISFQLDGEPVDLMNNPPPFITREILNKIYDGEVPAGFNTGAGVLKFTNTDAGNHRIECLTNDTENIRVLANHNSTVVNLDPKIEWTHIGTCLSPKPSTGFVCTPETASEYVQFSKVRSNFPSATFVNVPFNVYGNDVLIGSNVTLNRLSDMEPIGLTCVFENMDQTLMSVYNSWPEVRSIRLQPLENFVPDVDVTQGNGFVDEDSFWLCLAPAQAQGLLGYLTMFHLSNLSSNPNKTINITVDGIIHTGLPLSESELDNYWNDVPVTVSITPDGDLIIGNMGIEPINEVLISSPDFELISIPDSELFPDASSNSTTGTGVGNTGATRFTEYVGGAENGNYVIVTKEWVTGTGQRLIGTSTYLKNGNSGGVVRGGAIGQHHDTVDGAITFLTTVTSGFLDGKTTADFCQLSFEKTPDGNLRIEAISGTEMTLIFGGNGDFTNLFAPDSPNQESARLRNFGDRFVARLGIPS
ncbi:hypothetical protein KTH73_04080 [Acinetobacter courvalinii]|uniref:hypothetical protein n=1 Tax=Acinetobacter courvalinii TaxID=280147 RepID=UPI0021CD2947|nr:hypothetical protein [Acinetobacter courvalinii]MCU4389905.1 hypothetical protein [Acinetobacter courvalinii]